MDISSRLVVNQAALKLKQEPIRHLIDVFAADRRRQPPMTFSARPLRLATTDGGFDAALAARLHWSADTDAAGGAGGRRHPGRRAGARRRGGAGVHQPLRHGGELAWPQLELRPAELKAAFDGLPARQRDALQAAAAACAQLPRGAEEGERRELELPRSGRHAAGPEGHAAGPRRHLRAGRQGGLSVVGADERHPGPRGRRRRDHHGGADPARREEPAGAGRGARRRRHPRLHHRRRAGRGRAGLRHRDRAARGQDHRPRQRLRGQRQAPRVRPGRAST